MGGSRPDGLRDKSVCYRYLGLTQEFREILVDMRHPVFQKQVLVLPCDGALESHHGIDPWCVFRLHKKLGVRTVLAPGVGDLIVNHRNFPVVSQVDSPFQ